MQAKQKLMLQLSFDQFFNETEYDRFKEQLLSSDSSILTIGLLGIQQKLADDRYTTLDEYIKDIDSVVDSYTHHLKHDKTNVREAAQNLKTKSSLHVKLIEACTECFERLMKDDKNCLTDACATPHVLVHVRMQGFPIWPGKLMSVDGDKAHILFFGDHSQVDIALKHCFLYSEHFCKRNSKNQQLNKAKKEAKAHIEKLKQKFGQFCPASEQIAWAVYDSRSLNMALENMFPDASAQDTTPSSATDEPSSLNTWDDVDGKKGITHDDSVLLVPVPPVLSNQNVTTASNDNGAAQENLAPLQKLKIGLAIKIQEAEEIWQQLRRVQNRSIEINCAHCATPLEGPFFCTDNCQRNFHEFERISDDE